MCVGMSYFVHKCFAEVFPYIAHTCYVRSRNCEPTVRDCGVFDRLLVCCCHHHLGIKCELQLFKKKLHVNKLQLQVQLMCVGMTKQFFNEC